VSGRAEIVQFAAWFVGTVENFRFFDARVQASADPEAAVAESRARGGSRRPVVSTVRSTWCSCAPLRGRALMLEQHSLQTMAEDRAARERLR
jgi:hypothetical protein